MPKYKDFETLNYMRDIAKSWAKKADSSVIIDNIDFLAGRQCTAIAKAAIDVMEADGTQRSDVVAFTGSDILARIPILVGMLFSGHISLVLTSFAPAPSRRHMLNESGARLLFVDHATRCMAEEVMTDEYSYPIVEEKSFADLATEIDPEELLVHTGRNKAGDWNTLRYTSGSTGTPKGMPLTHRSTELMTYNYINRIGDVDLEGRFLCTMPLSSLEGCGMARMFVTSGLVPCIYRRRATPVGILSEMERYRITALFLPFSRMIAIVRDLSFEMTDLFALKSIVYAGQTISPTDLNEAVEAIGDDKLLQAHGQTEAGMLSTLDQADHCSSDSKTLSGAGRLFFPEDIEIRDDDGNVAPEGVSGEIFVKGDYIDSARWTLERSWVPTVQPNGWIATTDMVRRIGGRIWITGHKRGMVLYRGYNIPTHPIEEALQRYEDMLDTVIHLVEDSYAGGVIFAWLKLNEDATVDEEAVSDFIQANVSKWSRPSHIEFVGTLSQVSALKKTDKASLRRWTEERLAEGRVERLKDADGVL